MTRFHWPLFGRLVCLGLLLIGSLWLVALAPSLVQTPTFEQFGQRMHWPGMYATTMQGCFFLPSYDQWAQRVRIAAGSVGIAALGLAVIQWPGALQFLDFGRCARYAARMRFSLRTLLIVMLVGGPVLAGLWWTRAALVPLGVLILSSALAFCLLAFTEFAIERLAAGVCRLTRTLSPHSRKSED